jgi:iron complex transport system substrate-binding protein
MKNQAAIFSLMIKRFQFIRIFLLICLSWTIFGNMALCNATANTHRFITDQMNRTVQLPERITSVAALFPDAARILVGLGEGDKITGIDGFETRCSVLKVVFPKIKNITVVGAVHSGTLSLEKLARVKPDVVFINGIYTDVADTIQNQLGIPVVCIYATVYRYDDFLASIHLIGKVMKQKNRAEEMTEVIRDTIVMIHERTMTLAEPEKPSILLMGMPFSNEKMMVSTYFALLPYIGAVYAPGGDLERKTTGGPGLRVSMEHILKWDPDYIFLNGMVPFGPKDLESDPVWQGVRSVKKNRVFKISTGHMGYEPANFAIMPLAMVKLLHPDLFSDINGETRANQIMETIYGVPEIYSRLKEEYGLTDF